MILTALSNFLNGDREQGLVVRLYASRTPSRMVRVSEVYRPNPVTDQVRYYFRLLKVCQKFVYTVCVFFAKMGPYGLRSKVKVVIDR